MDEKDILDDLEERATASNIHWMLLLEAIPFITLVFGMYGQYILPYFMRDAVTLGSLTIGSFGLIITSILTPILKRPRPDVNWAWASVFASGILFTIVGTAIFSIQIDSGHETLIMGLVLIATGHLLLAIYGSISSLIAAAAKTFFWLQFGTFALFSFGIISGLMSWHGGRMTFYFVILFGLLSLAMLLFAAKTAQQTYLYTYIPRILYVVFLSCLTVL